MIFDLKKLLAILQFKAGKLGLKSHAVQYSHQQVKPHVITGTTRGTSKEKLCRK